MGQLTLTTKIAAVLAAGALVATPALADPAAPQRSLSTVASDAWITAQVKLRLILEPGIALLNTNVDTDLGVVTLAGTVSIEDGKREAARQAQRVAGVKRVQNELEVVAKKS